MTTRQLPDWIDVYLDYVSNTEPAEQFKLWTAISCIAACLRRKVVLEFGALTLYPNIYIVLVAPSGGRKGTAMGPGYKMLRDLNIRMSAEATTREALIRALNISSDTHIGEAGDMYIHSSLTIYSQELTVFLGYDNKQLMSDLTDWYDCRERWTYDTKHQGTDAIINIWVNLFGATTPSLLQTTLPQDAIGGGLTSRMIFVYAPGKGAVIPRPTYKEELYVKLTHDLEQIGLMAGVFKLSPDFVDAYEAWYKQQDDHPPFDDDRLAGYLERRPNHVLKLSMIFGASEGSTLVLQPRHFERALQVLTAAEANMLQVFKGIGKSSLASLIARMQSIIATKRTVLYAELVNRFLHDADGFSIDKALQQMSNAGMIRTMMTGNVHTVEWIGPNPNEFYERI